VVKFKKNNYQDLPWNNTIEEDTFRYPDLFAGGFAASKNNQQGQKGYEQGVGVESLTMGQTLIPFPPAKRSG
jgi:hypothetical protein